MEIRVINANEMDMRDINIVTLVGEITKLIKWHEKETGHQSIKFKLKVRDYHDNVGDVSKGKVTERTSFIKVLLLGEVAKTYWNVINNEGDRVSIIGVLAENEMKGEGDYRTEWLTVEAQRVKLIGEREVKPTEAIRKMNEIIEGSIKDWKAVEKEPLNLEGSELDTDFTQEEIDWIVSDGPTGETIDTYAISDEMIEEATKSPEMNQDEMDTFR